jgi:hypothetical protein
MVMLSRDSDAVVMDFYNPIWSGWFGGNSNFDRCRAAILHRVADQVLKKPYEIAFVT